MENWRMVWRQGILPLADEAGLRSLLEALERDDPRLIQGATTQPPPLACVQDWPVEGCDALTWLFWQEGEVLTTVSECEEAFARACFEIDQNIGEPAGCRWFLNWWDETPRAEAFALLAQEIREHLHDAESGPMWAELEESRPHDWALQGILADWYEDRGESATARGLRFLAEMHHHPMQALVETGTNWQWVRWMNGVRATKSPWHLSWRIFQHLDNRVKTSGRVPYSTHPTFRQAVLAACAAIEEAYPHE